jgi:hypothetical protein
MMHGSYNIKQMNRS